MCIEYEKRSENPINSVNKHCFNTSEGLYSDTPEMNYYSMYTNIFTVLYGAVKVENAARILKTILSDIS